VLFTTCALNIDTAKLEYFNYQLTPGIKVIDAIMASSALPFLFPSYEIKNNFYYDGGLVNDCPSNLVDPLDSIAFRMCESKRSSKFNLFKLLYSLIELSNNTIHLNSDIHYHILDNKFGNQWINLSQTRDDVFNIYMNGYKNSKQVIFDSFVALKSS
jgi:predicted patatin/cPLA2 family phospholipase